MRERFIRALRNVLADFMLKLEYLVLVCAYCDKIIEHSDGPVPHPITHRRKFTLCYPCWQKLHYGLGIQNPMP